MAKSTITQLRDFPSVEELLQNKKLSTLIKELPRPIVANIVKNAIVQSKQDFRQGNKVTHTKLIEKIIFIAQNTKRKEITKVINATGVVVHTNLGRAPLSDELFDEIRKTTVGFGNVEFDLLSGKRGKRGEACESYLAELSQAESSTVVNNCAAALFLTVNALSNKKQVIISRSELVQIGGGFRIPDILKKAGAKLVEVGSTNITTIPIISK